AVDPPRDTHLGGTAAAAALCRRVALIQERRKRVLEVRDQERCRRRRDERQFEAWKKSRVQSQAVVDMALDRIEQLRLPDKQDDVINRIASTSQEQSKVPYWLRTRAARFVRMQRYRLGERIRAQQRAHRAVGIQPHISHLMSRVLSAAAFLAVSGVELTLPWPDELTKQMALQPPHFLLEGGRKGESAADVEGLPPAPAPRTPGPLLGCAGPRKEALSSTTAVERRQSPTPVQQQCIQRHQQQLVQQQQLQQQQPHVDPEYEAQLEMFRRRQANGGGGQMAHYPGDCPPLSPESHSPPSSPDRAVDARHPQPDYQRLSSGLPADSSAAVLAAATARAAAAAAAAGIGSTSYPRHQH
ncbi:unnamed protein product, partial [Ectocarpus sp. 4 AP-2014]